MHVPNLFPIGITNGSDVLDDIKQAFELLGGKFKPPPSFGGHFYQGEGNGGVEAQQSKVEVRGLCYCLGVDVESKKLSVKFTHK